MENEIINLQKLNQRDALDLVYLLDAATNFMSKMNQRGDLERYYELRQRLFNTMDDLEPPDDIRRGK